MKKLLISLVLVVLMIAPVSAIQYESITVATASIGLTAANLIADGIVRPKRAYCTLETAQIRFRVDGSAPTTSEGHIMDIGGRLILETHEELKNFRAIRTGATSGVLKCSY